MELHDLIKKLTKKIFGIGHLGQYYRFLLFRRNVEFQIQNARVIIDAGCGDGLYSLHCARKNKKTIVFSYDIKEVFLQENKKRVRLNNVEFRKLDLNNPIPQKNADFIYCIDVLEHIHNYQKVLNNIYDSLRKGGFFYLHVPTKIQKRIFKRFKNWKDANHVRSGFDFIELKDSLKDAGFRVMRYAYSFGFLGKLSWELDRMSDKIMWVKYLFLPILKLLINIDVLIPKQDGNGIWVLTQKE